MTFNDIFKSGFLQSVTEFSAIDMLLAMLFASIVGLFIFLIYKKTFSGVMYSESFALTMVGLSLVTTLVILAVTSNVVLSLGMVGALSIVRFRAAIKEPMEIVFLFWSIAAGIVIGAGMIPLAVIGSVVIGIIVLIFANRAPGNTPYILVLHCADERVEEAAIDTMHKLTDRYAVKSKTVTKSGIELTLEVRLKDTGTLFVNRLSDMDGVDSAVLVAYNGQYMS